VSDGGWRRQVSAHPFLAFAAMTYGLAWTAWLGVVTVGGPGWELAGIAGIYSPALSCLLVVRVIDPSRRARQGRARWLAFTAAWLVSTAVFTAYVAVTSGVREPAAVVVFAVVGLLPATVVASAWSSSPQLRQVLRTLIRVPGAPGWYGVALLLPPAVLVLGAQLTERAGGQVLWTPDPPPTGVGVVGFAVVTFAYTLLYAGGLNEEIGWTGFALRRLLRSASPLTASVALWALWITWHLPFHFSGHWNADPVAFRVALVTTFFARFLFTWLFVRSGGGLWTAIAFHTSANVAFALIPATWAATALFGLLALIAIVTDHLWRRSSRPRRSVSVRAGRPADPGRGG
jgi:membrane protease YdiL (CAAX protease family)